MVFNSQRHDRAKEQRQFFEEVTGNKGRYSDFLRNETPLVQNLVVYDVSYQFTYSSTKNEFSFKSPVTYKIYTIESSQTSGKIYRSTIDAIQNMKDRDGNTLNTGLKEQIEDKTKVDLSKTYLPRGMEKGSSASITPDILDKVIQSKGFYVEPNDEKISVKGKGKSTSEMKSDLSRYI